MMQIILVSVGIGCWFAAVALVGHTFLKKHKKENEAFARKNAEDAMKIKAKQFQAAE